MFLLNSRPPFFRVTSKKKDFLFLWALLFPKLQSQFAEFLQHDSLKRLRLLNLSTCVGFSTVFLIVCMYFSEKRMKNCEFFRTISQNFLHRIFELFTKKFPSKTAFALVVRILLRGRLTRISFILVSKTLDFWRQCFVSLFLVTHVSIRIPEFCTLRHILHRLHRTFRYHLKTLCLYTPLRFKILSPYTFSD